jgi:TolA-binding protein
MSQHLECSWHECERGKQMSSGWCHLLPCFHVLLLLLLLLITVVCLQADIAVTTSSGEYVTATETEEVNQEQQQQLKQQQQQALWAQQQREAQRQHEQQQQRQQHEQQKQAQLQKQLQQQQSVRQEQEQTQQRLRQQFLQSPPPQLPSPPSDVTLNSALAAIPQAVAGAVEVAVAVAVNPGRPEDAQLYAGNAAVHHNPLSTFCLSHIATGGNFWQCGNMSLMAYNLVEAFEVMRFVAKDLVPGP